MFHDNEEWCRIYGKTDLWFVKWQRNLANFHMLKNSDFILGSKMTELNQKKKNSKQLDRPGAVRKLYFTVELNE